MKCVFCSGETKSMLTTFSYEEENKYLELVWKNWTHVRQWLGYHRFDNPEIVPLLNELYKTEWRLFHNFFCPSVKLLEKQRIASKTIRRYDSPKTPYQRIMESPDITAEVKKKLSDLFLTLNPFLLRKAMEKKLNKIFNLYYKKSPTLR